MTDDRLEDLEVRRSPEDAENVVGLLGADPKGWLRRRGIRPVPLPSKPCKHCGADAPDKGCESGMVLVESQDAYARCPRAAAYDRARRVERRREAAGINWLYSRMRFSTFEPTGRGSRAVKREVEDYVSRFDGFREEGRGLLLHGAVGVGKSHLAYAAVNALIERGEDALAITATKLLEAIRGTYSGDDAERARARERLRRITNAEVLLLDDIGKSKSTEWVQEQFHELLTDRRGEMLVTIATSNHAPTGELAARIGESSESRLVEMCRVLHLGGEDYRRREREGGRP